MASGQLSSEFLAYLANIQNGDENYTRLPSLIELSKTLGVSVSTLREQMEVARALGFIEVRPRTGIRRQQYVFLPAVRQSLLYAITLDRDYFEAFSDLRRHVEASYWHQAVQALLESDRQTLRQLVVRARAKLNGHPIQIPQSEHRELHLTIYRRLNNPFVFGILEAYWEAYEAVGLNVYADFEYLKLVWDYHERMVESICQGDYEAGFTALVEHTALIRHRITVTPLEG